MSGYCDYIEKSSGNRCEEGAIPNESYCNDHISTRQAKKARKSRPPPPTPRSNSARSRPNTDRVVDPRIGVARTVVNGSGRSRQRPKKTVNRHIKLNKHGRYEDPETHIIFRSDAGTVLAMGVQNNDGTVSPLSQRNVEVCKRNGWKYEVRSAPTRDRHSAASDRESRVSGSNAKRSMEPPRRRNAEIYPDSEEESTEDGGYEYEYQYE